MPHVLYQHYIKVPRVKLLQTRRTLVESAGDVSAGEISSVKSSTLINPAHQLNPAVRPAAGTGRVLIDSEHSSQSFNRREREKERRGAHGFPRTVLSFEATHHSFSSWLQGRVGNKGFIYKGCEESYFHPCRMRFDPPESDQTYHPQISL